MADLLEKLDGLIVQATHERSHYYVKSVAVEAKAEIERHRVLLGIAKDGFRESEAEIKRLRDVINCGCNAVHDAIAVSGGDLRRINAVQRRMREEATP